MQKPIPVVRTASLGPLFLWMQQNQRPFETALERVGLSFLQPGNPLQVIPLHNVARLLANESREAGPDLPVRVVRETSAITEAMIGPFLAAAQTPRNAVTRVAAALPSLSSHEHLLLEPGTQETVIRHLWGTSFDTETLHYLHQFTAAMTEMLFAQLPADTNGKLRIDLVPHPEVGLDHLRSQMRSELLPGGKILAIHAGNRALNTPFRNAAGNGKQPPALPNLEPLRSNAGLTDTVRLLIRGMLEVAPPTSAELARAAGLSHRTFQRRLAQEGTSFRRLLDDVRRDAALEWLEGDAGKLSDLSLSLGYAHPTALTRAMHRWVGDSPDQARKRGVRDPG